MDLLRPDTPVIVTAWYPQRPTAVPALIEAGVRGVVVMPVVERGQRVGFVAFVWLRRLASLPSAAEPLASRLAELIGRALERQAYIEDLKDTREGALLALGLSLELRDFETHGHTERVVRLSAELGRTLGLSLDELEGLRQGAYLHDVGKLAVPDRILLKQGKLDADEWRVMQSHPVVGAEMTLRVTTIHPLALGVIRHHHERWGGTGYPDGLTGEEIPLAARIFSVVDVFDALTSERPDKRAGTRGEALAEIQAQVGRQFDPRVVAAFQEL